MSHNLFSTAIISQPTENVITPLRTDHDRQEKAKDGMGGTGKREEMMSVSKEEQTYTDH